MDSHKGKIIILNGVSSAGKTTLAKVLQERLSQPFFHIDVDMFCIMAPQKFLENDYSLQHNFVSNMFDVVKLFSDKGYSLIVPCAFLEGYGYLEKCVSLLHSYQVLFVHVTCPIEELIQREKKRGDRPLGSAEAMLPMLVPQGTYDIMVDTYKYSTIDCADKLVEMLNTPEKLTSFKELWTLQKEGKK